MRTHGTEPGRIAKTLSALVLVAIGAFAYSHYQPAWPERPDSQATTSPRIGEQADHTQVRGAGIVSRVLADDDNGSRHQRFILRLPSGQTLLMAHNIDLAPRIANLREGDTVEFSGEYVWNA